MPSERLRPFVHPRFDLDTIALYGRTRALRSAVPFEDEDFRAAASPSPRWRFGQTNYRLYVRDRQTGEHCVWFLGTTLGSWTVLTGGRARDPGVGLLDRLGLVPYAERREPYSVLIQPSAGFGVTLPPRSLPA